MEDFNTQLEKMGEYGIVEEVHHPIVQVNGLPGSHMDEIVMFENGELGQVFQIEGQMVDILVFSKEAQKVGTKVTRSGEFSSVPVGEELLGAMIDPLGKPLSEAKPLKRDLPKRQINTPPMGIPGRTRIKKPLITGVTLIDTMLPLGMGQKELVIGDRKTGKTSFLLSTIKNQVQSGNVAIYVAVAKKKSDIKKIQDFFEKEGLSHNTIIVATSSFDSPSLIFLAPYAGMSIAEYFRDQGKDTLIVIDDLTTHARFYREISLLANRFPGRDSYPGDIFYTHARLLERVGNFTHTSGKDVSITLLPVAEIVEGDFTGYISTNLMGMTDGHLYFDSNIFYKGRRPAVNILLSVTRVGRQTQTPVQKSINRELTSFFAIYEKMQSLSHFGAELTDTVTNILKTGDAIYTLFDQPYNLVVPAQVQLILFSMLWLKYFEANIEQIPTYRDRLVATYKNPAVQKLFEEIIVAKTFNDLLANVSKRKDELLAFCEGRHPWQQGEAPQGAAPHPAPPTQQPAQQLPGTMVPQPQPTSGSMPQAAPEPPPAPPPQPLSQTHGMYQQPTTPNPGGISTNA